MRFIAVIVGLFVAATIFAINSPNVSAEAASIEIVKSKKVVTVQPGDSLSKIAKKHKSTYQRIFFANTEVKDPDIIVPGQKLRIPNEKEVLKERPLQQVVAATRPVSQPKATSYKPQVAPKQVVGGSVWDRLAACESGGNWSINTGNGYYGGLQFSLSSWRGVGGTGYPHQASKAEQIKRGQMLQARGGWGHWPACSAKLGLR